MTVRHGGYPFWVEIDVVICSVVRIRRKGKVYEFSAVLEERVSRRRIVLRHAHLRQRAEGADGDSRMLTQG